MSTLPLKRVPDSLLERPRAEAPGAPQRARLEKRGSPPSFVDGQIAAIAATRGMILVSRNVRDFERFEGLALENWFESE